MRKARYYLLSRKEQGFGTVQVIYRYERIRWSELKRWKKRGWKVIA
ncbi:hypothetical protein [Aneurinibacillus soli]|nr:hypothetical protein [Aneurinibacillus soli]